MTSKLNRAKQRIRSWQAEYHNLRKMVQAARHLVLSGCRLCDVDEAEGGVVNHCEVCCRRITTEAYGLFVRGDMPQRPRNPRRVRLDATSGCTNETDSHREKS
jgi:hypothetical protein